MTQGQSPVARRIERLGAEVGDELSLNLPSRVLVELDYALRPPVHEGRSPSFGAIVDPTPDVGQQRLPLGREIGAQLVASESEPSMTMRQLSDGYATFLWRDRLTSLVLLEPFAPTSPAVNDYVASTGVVVIRRGADGVVTLSHESGVATFEAGRWRSSPTTNAYLSPFRTLFETSRPENEVARSILSLCLDVLSPARIGATLIWRSGVELSKETHLDTSAAIELPRLQITEHSHHGAIKSVLSQHDRAAIVEGDGTILMAGVGLTALGTDMPTTGTRHASARAYSTLHTQNTIFVVSSDGPVTVFRAGHRVVDHASVVGITQSQCQVCNGVGTVPGSNGHPAECDLCGGAGVLIEPSPTRTLTHAEASTVYRRADKRRQRRRAVNFTRLVALMTGASPAPPSQQMQLDLD